MRTLDKVLKVRSRLNMLSPTDLQYLFNVCITRNACECYDEAMEALIEMDELADLTEEQEDYLEALTISRFPL